MSEKDLIDLDTLLTPLEHSHLQVVNPGAPSIYRILETLLHVASEPLKTNDLNEILGFPGVTLVHQALTDLQQTWSNEQRGIEIIEVNNGWQIRTHPDMAQWVLKLKHGKPRKLSKAALEALAIIAYRQPVTRSEVEQLRGVDSSGVIQKLIVWNLIEVIGKREDEPGKPDIIGTTKTFLSVFNLRDLLDLPTLEIAETESTEQSILLNPLEALSAHFPPT